MHWIEWYSSFLRLPFLSSLSFFFLPNENRGLPPHPVGIFLFKLRFLSLETDIPNSL